ncbi:MAG: hypothetical protein PVI57_16695 [Gemmatimonadota bacterium]|jgi:hypothetical protein
MTEDRRYDEDEVRQIFDEAAASPSDRLPGPREAGPSDGLTLEELQSIGEEVGLPPERIADAAASLERRGSSPARRTLLGAPLTVGRTVALPREPTDREWGMLVAELRQTFGARGRVEGYGRTREWSNGNLHARIEPSGTGPILRLGTLKASALTMSRAGGFMLALGLVLVTVALLGGGGSVQLDLPVLLSLLGGGLVGSSVLRLPPWARRREKQMEHIAGWTHGLLEAPPDAD